MSVLPALVALATFAVAVAAPLGGTRRPAAAARRRVDRFLARPAPEPERVEQGRDAGGASGRRLLAAVESRLERLPLWCRVAALVERADLPLRPAELLVAAAGSALLLAGAALAAGASRLAAAALPAAALAAGAVALAVRVERRRRAFDEQLPEILGGMSAALRAGHSLGQALVAAAADAAEPAAAELRRVLAENRLGRPLEDALARVAQRVASRDLDFVLDAVVVQRQVGGSLAGIFDVVADSVRQRQQFALRVRALTAMARLSAHVLVALPLAVAALLTLVNHAYLAPLRDTHAGRVMLVAATLLAGAGWLWLRRIVRFGG